jgi:hypothetical protein
LRANERGKLGSVTIPLDLSADLNLDLACSGSEPLSMLSPLRGSAELEEGPVELLEFSCRGDRVPCTLVVPPSPAPVPVVLVQLEPSEDAGLSSVPEWTKPWIAGGCALASIDLPLQGTRRSAKLTELLADARVKARSGQSIGDATRLLWYEFTRQAVLELHRTLDVIAAHSKIDADRMGYAGFGLGAHLGAILCAVDARPSAVVLAGGAAGITPTEIAPEQFVGKITPRPLLFVNDESSPPDAAAEREAAERLHREAQGKNTKVEWSAPSQRLETAWRFLSSRLNEKPSSPADD